MKNKKNIYILLTIVLGIWGMVIYRLFSFSNPDTNIPATASNFTFKPIEVKARDTFSIDVNYRDPFLGKMYSNDVQKKNTSHVPIVKKDTLIWPNIIYKGLVSDSKEKKKVFLVSINGQTYFMNEKTTEQEVTLKKGDRNTIEVLYKGKKNKIGLQ
ncbi:hypothetical protein [Flavobacterium beibuense]|uniref:hypothetical protein n=1 Tax=Flavobacterium beibuense TaxID=657326 RepID=UPI003A8F68E6